MRGSFGKKNNKIESLPLSKMQQGLLLHAEISTNNQFYISQIRIDIKHSMNIELLNTCCQFVMDKHKILRSSISSNDLQKASLNIHNDIQSHIDFHDFSRLNLNQRQNKLAVFLDKDFKKRIDITKAPLMRWTLIKLTHNHYYFIWTHHHAILSGNEIAKILKEIFDCYDTKQLVSANDPDHDYSHYIEILKKPQSNASRNYWKKLLKNFEPKELLIAKKPEELDEYNHVIIHDDISPLQFKKLRQAALQNGVTDYTILSSTWAIVLSLFSNETDIVFGSVRSFPEKSLDNVVGLFINTLPIRVNLTSKTSPAELFDSIRKQQIKLRSLVHTSLSDLNKLLKLTPNQSLFETYIDYKPASINQLLKNLKGKWLKRTWDYRLDTHYKLYLEIFGENNRLTFRIHFDSNTYSETAIKPLMQCFKTVLDQLVSGRSKYVAEIDGLSKQERQERNQICIGKKLNYSSHLTAIRLFEAQAFNQSKKIALVDAKTTLSYSELNQLANQLAHKIQSKVKWQNKFIGVCLAKSYKTVVAILAIQKTGNAYVPLDPAYPIERINFIIDNCKMAAVIVENDVLDPRLQIVYQSDHDLCGEATSNVKLTIKATDLAYAIYTSGTTGTPKGVAISHSSLVNLIHWHQHTYRINAVMKIALISPFTFDAATWMLWSALANGAQLHLVANHIVQDPLLLQQFLLSSKIDQGFIPSAMVSFLLQLNWPQKHSFKQILTGGEKLNLNNLPPKNISVINHYGPTEYTVITTANLDYSNINEINFIGKPIFNTTLYILDCLGRPSPRSIPGELCISGNGIAQGYIGSPNLTKKAFIKHNQSTTLYKTGDLVKLLPCGQIEFIGRSDTQVKVKGYRIELGEIENVFSKHKGLDLCCANVISNASGQKQIALYYSLKNASIQQEQLEAYAKSFLPHYMLPNRYIHVDKFELTAHGKIDKNKLPLKGKELIKHTKKNLVLDNSSSLKVYQIICDILSIKLNKMDVNASLFDYGGDSITVMQIIQKLHSAGFSISADQIFKHPTLSHIASMASNNKTKSITAKHLVKLSKSFPVTPIQQWYLSQAHTDNDRFNQSITIHLKKELDCNKLEAAFKLLITKNDALRLKFNKRNNKWYASSCDSAHTFKLEHNLNAIDKVSFDLTQGLLIYAAVDRTHKPTTLFISIHHLAVDVVSWKIILQDLEYLYTHCHSSKTQGESNNLTSFQQWAVLLKKHGSSLYKSIRAHYWREKLAQYRLLAETMTENQSDKSNNQWGDVKYLKTVLPTKITQSLINKANAAYNTRVIDLIVTALLDSFSESIASEKILALLIEGHGRTDLDTIDPSQIVGWFTTLAPLVVKTATADTSEKIRIVKELLNDFQEKALAYSLLSSRGDSDYINPIPTSELIGLNYLGVVNQDQRNQLLSEQNPTVSLDVQPDKKRPLLIDLLVFIHQEHLHIEVSYNSKFTTEHSLAEKIEQFSTALTALIQHCSHQDHRQYSPSDFPLLQTSQEDLDEFINTNLYPILKSDPNCKVTDIFPLSPLQDGIHYHYLQHPDSDFYHVQTILEMNDKLETNLFKNSVITTLSHFDIFRTGFTPSHNLNSIQFVLSEVHFPWQFYDWSRETRSIQEKKYNELITIDRERLFKLSAPPLIRCYLIKLSQKRYRFILAYHHIILGGWSMAMIVNHILLGYRSKQTLPIASSCRPYVEWTVHSDHEHAKHYWKKLLGSYHTPLKLTNENYLVSSLNKNYKRHTLSKKLNRTVTHELKTFAASHSLTLNSLLLGAWCYVLSRYADANDIVIGTTLATRPAEVSEIDTMIGLLNSTLPIRASYQSSDLFIDYILALQNQLRSSQKYQFSKLVDITECSGLKDKLPLFEYLYVFENYPLDTKKLKQLGVDSLSVIEKPHYKITLTVHAQDTIVFNVTYDQSVFSSHDLEQMMSSTLSVIQSIPQTIHSPLKKIEIVSESDKQALLKLWQAGNLNFDTTRTLRDHYQEQYARVPNKTAIVFDDIAISYKTLDSESNKLANQLLAEKIKSGDIIGVILNRDLNLIYTYIAIVKLGCTVLPIDFNYPEERISHILAAAKPHIIVTKKLFSKKIKKPTSKLFFIDLRKSEIAEQPTQLPHLTISNQTPAYLLFTSGSTGVPKGVIISYASLINFLHSAKQLTRVTERNHFLISTTYTFDIFNYEFHMPFILGATATLIEHHDQIDGHHLSQIIEKNKIDVIQATPVTWNMLFDAGFIVLKHLTAICGGDVMTKQIANYMKAHGASVYNIYGPSETTIWSSIHEIKQIDETLASIPIGVPLHNTYFYVLNSDFQIAPQNAIGTLFIGGAGVGLGYLNNTKLTKQKFIPDPFMPNKLIYNSGDSVKLLHDGSFIFVGRNDNQVKIHGYRIELSEIENHINHIKQIKQSAVIIKGENEQDKKLIAFVTLQPNAMVLTNKDIKELLSNKLPTFMIPDHIEYLDKMPLSTSRKIDKKSLEQVNLTIQKSDKVITHDGKYDPLIKIWSDVLSCDSNLVDIHDNFFNVGGNSIQAVSLIAKINHELHTELGVNDLFIYPTIEALYDQLHAAKRQIELSAKIDIQTITSPLVCLQKEGRRHPLFLLHPIGGTLYIYQPLVQALGKTRPIYGIHDPSITAGDLVFSSFREMATYYVSLIKQAQPKGPYYLLGASFGANMVEEISKQLIHNGDIVAFTGLIDGWAHYPAKSHQKEWFYANLSRQHKMVAQMVGQQNQALPKTLLAINWHRQQLLGQHQLSYSENKITLFKADQLTPVLKDIDSEFNYWDMYYPVGLDLHIVPGDHESMLMPPNVEHLAEQILLYLQD